MGTARGRAVSVPSYRAPGARREALASQWVGSRMQTDPIPAPAAFSAAIPTPSWRGVPRRRNPAFEAIMRRHNQLLFRTARSILKSDVESEDVVQEAYLLAWRAIGSFRADAKLSTWLVRIVINQASPACAGAAPRSSPWRRRPSGGRCLECPLRAAAVSVAVDDLVREAIAMAEQATSG